MCTANERFKDLLPIFARDPDAIVGEVELGVTIANPAADGDWLADRCVLRLVFK